MNLRTTFLCAIAEKHAPVRQRRVKSEHKPWLTKEIKRLITIGIILKDRVFV
jgi:hypothetical protein